MDDNRFLVRMDILIQVRINKVLVNMYKNRLFTSLAIVTMIQMLLILEHKHYS